MIIQGFGVRFLISIQYTQKDIKKIHALHADIIIPSKISSSRSMLKISWNLKFPSVDTPSSPVLLQLFWRFRKLIQHFFHLRRQGCNSGIAIVEQSARPIVFCCAYFSTSTIEQTIMNCRIMHEHWTNCVPMVHQNKPKKISTPSTIDIL